MSEGAWLCEGAPHVQGGATLLLLLLSAKPLPTHRCCVVAVEVHGNDSFNARGTSERPETTLDVCCSATLNP